ncbi:MAG: MDR family MFS transporter [candidate division KSB1 bacterium]
MSDAQTRSTRLVTLAVFLQVFLAAMDNTIISTAMPTVVAALGGMRWYSWVFSAYLMASTIATPLAGKLSDQFSRKRIYLLGIAVFLLASMMCGVAPNMTWLIAWRIVQGVAAGTMFAVSLALTAVLYPPHQRGKVQGLFSSLWAIASIIGPVLGGYVVEHFSWRWTFYLNLPLGLLALVFINRHLNEPERTISRQQIDYRGAAMLTATITGLLYLVTNFDRLTPALALAGVFALVILFFLLLRLERKAVAPILPLALFRRKEIAAANLATFSTGVGAFGLILFAPLFVQGVLLRPATEAGLVLLPFSFGWAGGSLASGHMVNRLGYRNLAVLGAVLMMGGFVYLSTLGISSTLLEVSLACGIAGFGMGMITTAITVSVQNNVTQQELGVATASTIFSRALGAAIGTGVLGALLALRLASELKAVFPHNPSGAITEVRSVLLRELRTQMSPELLAQMQHGLAQAMRTIFHACVVTSLFALLVALRVSAQRPRKEVAQAALVEG